MASTPSLHPESEPFLPGKSPNYHPKAHIHRHGHLISITCTSIVWILAITFYNLSHGHVDNAAMASQVLTCGNSSAEARALGCEFDPLLIGWTPKPCIDHDLLEEYKNTPTWRGYRDLSGKEVLTFEEMMELDEYYGTARDHMFHCLMLWQKLQRALLNGTPRDNLITNLDHTLHCSNMLVVFAERGPEHLDMIHSTINPGFLTCQVV